MDKVVQVMSWDKDKRVDKLLARLPRWPQPCSQEQEETSQNDDVSRAIMPSCTGSITVSQGFRHVRMHDQISLLVGQMKGMEWGGRMLRGQSAQGKRGLGRSRVALAASEVTLAEKRKEKLFWKEGKAQKEVPKGAAKHLRHLLAGAVSGAISRTVMAPLERLKLEYMICGATASLSQLSRQILRIEGVSGFWRGNAVNLLRTVPFKAFNYFAFDFFRNRFATSSKDGKVSVNERLLAGAAAGSISTLICFPLDTVRTRMVASGGVQCFGHLSRCFAEIVQSEGPIALYRGLLPALLSMAPAGAVFYGTYDMLKTMHQQNIISANAILDAERVSPNKLGNPARLPGTPNLAGSDSTFETSKVHAEQAGKVHAELSGKPADVSLQRADVAESSVEIGPLNTMLYGAIAGVVAEVVTCPFEVVRRHMQLQKGAMRPAGLWIATRDLIQKGGVRALFSGIVPGTVQVLPSAALGYLVYEHMKSTLNVE